jgi:hypothetical protein
MDDTVIRAITAVQLDDGSVESWFELICRTHAQVVESGQVEWSHFGTALAEGAMAAGISRVLVDQFVEHMAANDMAPLETVGHLAEAPTELAYAYRESMSATVAADTTDVAYDEQAWQTFLVEHGARWDGTADAWDQFRTWFLYEAEQHQLAAPATGFITYAESQQDKTAVFAQYQVPLAAAEQQPATNAGAFPKTRHGDSGEWVEYLDAMLTHNGF